MPRTRKPTAIKALEGDRSKKGLNKNEPKPLLGDSVPPPPDFLNEDGRAEWNRLARQLWLNSLLGLEDIQGFAIYCEHYSNAMKYRRLLDEQIAAERGAEAKGEKAPTMAQATMIETTNGNWVQNPLVGMLNVSMREQMKAAQEFGLTPVSRSKVNVPRGASLPPPPDSEPKKTVTRAADFLNRGPRPNVVPIRPKA